jgi:hypothetical protein
MAKVFGDDPYTNNKIHVSDGDHRLVKDILALYDMNRALWQQVTLQSITYEYKFDEVVDKYKLTRDVAKTTNFSSFIHPVVAAMFLPKIARFDEYFLFTNLAYILRCKYLGEPISTYHSYLMLYNLVTDPTDVVCNADSPLKDILNRVMLQVNLWKNVIRLRQGGIYDTYNSFAAADLMANIDNCKLSTYDAPDLMMIGDENVIIRRLLSALAFRCATVFSTPTTIPLFNPNGQNPNMQVSALNIPINFTQVTKVPMIYIRLPPSNLPTVGGQAQTSSIQSALSTVQPMMYNGRLESRAMSVVGTDGVLIVSIPRRTYRPMSGNIYNLPQVFNFANMPHHAFGLETLNNTQVRTNLFLHLTNMKADNNKHSDKLFIKSAVVLKQREENKTEFIYGSKTYMFDYNTGEIRGSARVYDPLSKITLGTNDLVPVREISDAYNNNTEDQLDDFVTKQTILIYANEININNVDVAQQSYNNIKSVYDNVTDTVGGAAPTVNVNNAFVGANNADPAQLINMTRVPNLVDIHFPRLLA